MPLNIQIERKIFPFTSLLSSGEVTTIFINFLIFITRVIRSYYLPRALSSERIHERTQRHVKSSYNPRPICILMFCQFSIVRQSDPVMHTYISFSHIILHHALSQVTGYSSQCAFLKGEQNM